MLWVVSTTPTRCFSCVHRQYFSILESTYNAENPDVGAVAAAVYMPAMFYNWDLDQRAFFVRVTGIMRSMMGLGGLISYNLNPMVQLSAPF